MKGEADPLAELQRKLAERIFLIFLLPYLISIVLAIATLTALNSRVKQVEVAVKLANVERILAKDRNYGWAMAQYRLLARDDPRAEFLTRYAGLLFKIEPTDDSEPLEALRKARRLDPNYWEAYAVLAYIHLENKRVREAVEAGERSIQLNEYDAQTLNNLAWIYSHAEDPAVRNLERAKQYGEKAVFLTRRKNPEYLDTLAAVYEAAGNTPDAEAARKEKEKLAATQSIEPSGRQLSELMQNNDG